MIGELHRRFTSILIDKYNFNKGYISWSAAPDEDLDKYHRYTYHKLSNFNYLYDFCIKNYDMGREFNTRIISLIFLSHLYLDHLVSPIKVFDGINITCNHKLLDNIKSKGYPSTINIVYNSIHLNSKEHIDNISQIFKETELPNSMKVFTETIYQILLNETIGTIPEHQEHKLDIPYMDYHYYRCKLREMEDKIFEYVSSF